MKSMLFKIMLVLFPAFLPALSAFSHNSHVRIVIPPEVEVSGEEYYLGDVALLEGSNPVLLSELAGISFGRPPQPGTFRWLYRSYLELALQRAGGAAGSYYLEMPSRVKVQGACQKLTAAVLTETVHRLLAEYRQPEWRKWWLERLNLPAEILLPPGEMRVELANSPADLSPGSLLLRLRILAGGKEYRTIPVSCRLRAEAEVPVAGRDLERYTVLTGDAYTREVRELTGGEAIGVRLTPGEFRVTRPLRAGAVLTYRDIEPVPVVSKGDRVRIVARGSSLLVVVPGLAQEDGREGEEIAVKNNRSGKVIRATITGPGEVEVKI